jgi:phosphoribosylamine--glycine ligase
MKILIIGSGGREHAIVDAIAHNSQAHQIYAAPGNGGTASLADNIPLASDDIQGLLDFARNERMDLTFVGPEVPLSLGIVDVFQENGLKIVGPTAANARLESSKSFAKQFFKQHQIPTADFWPCYSAAEAYARLDTVRFPTVVKADGLAAGKGVVVAETLEQAQAAVRDFMESGTLGKAGNAVVIEEFLTGEEVSFMVFADGESAQPMVMAQDHKRRFDGDQGPNTGGMGAYSIDSIITTELHEQVMRTIIRPTLRHAADFSGILYAGLMLTPNGPKIIEYNTRFGDPETQVVLPRLRTDLLGILVDIAEHRLDSRNLEWHADVTATVALVASGYPGKVENGKRIMGLDWAERQNGVKVYHAGTRMEDGNFFTAGGRVLNVTGRGTTLRQALDRAYAACEMIEFEGKDYRRDIGKKGLATKR